MKLSIISRDRVTSLFLILLVTQLATLVLALIISSQLSDPTSIVAKLSPLGNTDEVASEAMSTPIERLLVEEDVATVNEEPKVVSYKVKRGENLATIWAKNGAPYSGALHAAEAFREARISTSSLKTGEEIELGVSLSGDITSLTRKMEDGRTLILRGNSLDGYQAEILEADIIETERSVSGVILSSFSASASDSEIPYSVVDEFVDLFSNRVEFRRDLQPGDTFTLTYLERKCRRSGNSLAPGRIVSASLKNGASLMVSIGHQGKDGQFHYYDQAGNPLGNYFLRYPLKFTRISSAFSEARFHPILNVNRPHNGVDFAAPAGTPVRAVANGVVLDAGYRGGGGNTIRIQHNDRYSTAYLHLSRIAVGLHKGSRVTRGQVLGAVGMSGLATGPHLHFSLFDRGIYVDPLKAKLPSVIDSIDPIPSQYLMAALKTIEQQHQVIAVAAAENGKRQS